MLIPLFLETPFIFLYFLFLRNDRLSSFYYYMNYVHKNTRRNQKTVINAPKLSCRHAIFVTNRRKLSRTSSYVLGWASNSYFNMTR